MIKRLFHAWEHRLAASTSDRVVRKFEWGIDWLRTGQLEHQEPASVVTSWSEKMVNNSGDFFETPETTLYQLSDDVLSFPSALETPDQSNNTVYARYHPTSDNNLKHRAIVVPLERRPRRAHVPQSVNC